MDDAAGSVRPAGPPSGSFRRVSRGEHADHLFLSCVDILPEKSTRLVSIVYTSSNPEFAAVAANALADEYARQNLDRRLEAINKNLVSDVRTVRPPSTANGSPTAITRSCAFLNSTTWMPPRH